MSSGEIVWLASYPKSGNTWVRLLLGNLLGLQDSDDADSFSPVAGISSARWIFDRYLSVDTYELTDEEIDRFRPAVYRKMAEQVDDLMFVKAHDSFQQLPDGQPIFPADCSRAAIYIVRDPLDVAVSYTHHRGETDFEKTVELMNEPTMAIGGKSNEQLRQLMKDWSGHYRSWTDQPGIPVLVVKYEDLSADTPGQLRRIADFVGLDESSFAMSYEEAAEASRFDRLQKIEAEKGFRERPVKADRFFRSGRSGEGREQLSERLQQKLTAHHAEVMRELGYLEGNIGE